MRERNPGFISGARCPFRAIYFIAVHPSLWVFCIVPLLVTALIAYFVWHWTGIWADHWVQQHVSGTGWLASTGRTSARVIGFLLRLLLTLVSIIVIGNVACVPFNDFLSERVDKLVTGWRDTRPRSVGRILRELGTIAIQELIRMSFYLGITILLFTASFIPVLAPGTTLVQLVFSAVFFALDYMSYPLERRGCLLFRDKREFTLGHLGPSLGFGLVMTALGLVPFVNFLFIPVGVVGGTLLHASVARSLGYRSCNPE